MTVVVMLAAGVPRSSAQPPPATPSSQAALVEAEQLDQLVVKLYHYYWAAFIPAGDWRPLDKSVFSPRDPQP